MGKKPQRHGWPEAKKLCRLNQLDITMAKALGFGPDALIRAIPDRKQKWKLPVKYWIHDLYERKFGHVLGERPIAAVAAEVREYDPEAARRFEEELYWEDYRVRNRDSGSFGVRATKKRSVPVDPNWKPVATDITGDDVPF